MILDTIGRLPLYGSVIPNAVQIHSAFTVAAPDSAPCEVREKSYDTKPDEKRRFEVHAHTIDLMIAKSGAEVIHICPETKLIPAEPLPNNGDGRKLDGAPCGTAVVLTAGCFCAIFPGEAHMVGGRINGEDGNIDKWVVKAPCLPEFSAEV